MKNIREDHNDFHEIIAGKKRDNLKKFISSGRIFRHRGNGKGQISIPIPRIDQPHIVYGRPDEDCFRRGRNAWAGNAIIGGLGASTRT
jgi:hypothetical protein